MTTYERKGWFRVELPDGWVVEEGEPLVFHHPDRSGALQVSALTLDNRKRGDHIDVLLALRGYLRGSGVEIDESRAKRESRKGHEIASYEYVASEEGEATLWRIWFVTNQDVLAMATYNCPEADRDAERREVDAVMASLTLTSLGIDTE